MIARAGMCSMSTTPATITGVRSTTAPVSRTKGRPKMTTESTLAELDTVVTQLEATRDTFQVQHDEAAAAVAAAERMVKVHAGARELLKLLQEATSKQVAERISALATAMLRRVFNDEHASIELRPVVSGQVVELELIYKRDNVEVDPLTGTGGGVQAVLSVILRAAITGLMTEDGLSPYLFLDEPFAALSESHRAPMAELLEEIAAEFDLQPWIITHVDTFQRGRVYRAEFVSTEGVAEARLVLEVD